MHRLLQGIERQQAERRLDGGLWGSGAALAGEKPSQDLDGALVQSRALQGEPVLERLTSQGQLPNVLVTPHIGYNTAEAASNMLRISIATLEAWARGERLHVVN